MRNLNIGDSNNIRKFIEDIERRRKDLKNVGFQNKRIVDRIQREVIAPLKRDFKEDKPDVRLPGDKINWKSNRQRNLYMMERRKKGLPEGPYERTGKMGESIVAEVKLSSSGKKIDVNIDNTDPKAPYVIGEIGLGVSRSSIRRYEKPIQPFHKKRWEPAYKKVQPAVEKAQEIYYEEITKWIADTFDFKE